MTASTLPVVCQWTGDGDAVGEPITLPLGASLHGQITAPRGLSSKPVLKIALPIPDIAGVWTPYGDRGSIQRVVWRGRLVGSPEFFPGLIAFVDRRFCNRLLLLTRPTSEEVVITWALDQAAACYRIEINFGKIRSAQQVSVCYSAETTFVHDVARRLFAELSPGLNMSSPRECFEPSFCTWYAWHGALEERSVERCARLARDLGFGTFILDDGWQYDADQRVGAALGAWHRFNGDYEPSKRKFPDFGAHVERVKGMGLRYLLWVAPMLIGVESKAFERFGGRLFKSWLDEGFRVVDPRDKEVGEYVAGSLERLVREYPIDGFKVDYDYALLGPNQTPHDVGVEYVEFVRSLIARVRRIRPSFEWNLMLNAFSAGVTNAFRCVDVPFDPDSNRLFLANVRPLAGRRALYSDPALWSPQDSIATVRRHLVPTLFCVPSVGAPLLDLPKEHLEVLRGWLGFYRRHQTIFRQGEFRAQWIAGDFQSFESALGDQRVLAAFSSHPIALGGQGENLLINATDEDFLRVELERPAQINLEDSDGKPIASPKRLSAGLQRVDCPSGGIVRLQLG